MNIFRYIVILLTICTAFISCEREDSRRYPVEESGRPIRFTTESVWPDITKAPITGLGDLLDDGFRVWGAWAKDPDDNSYFVGEYSTGSNGSVFGQGGTLVNAVDVDKDDDFDPVGSKDTWSYASERNWYRGYYSFAAILPESSIGNGPNALVKSASLTSSFSKIGSGNDIQIAYSNTLNVIFPSKGLLLGGHNIEKDIEVPEAIQKDIMFAFQTEDNSDNQSENVALNFTHAFARLGIKLLANDHEKMPFVTKVTVYGLYGSAASMALTQITTVQNYRTSSAEVSIENSTSVNGVTSTESQPFAVFSMPDGHYENDSTPGDMVLVQKLVVFPQDLVEMPLMIKLEYRKPVPGAPDDSPQYTDETYTYTITLNKGELVPGGNYLFAFQVDELNFNEISNN